MASASAPATLGPPTNRDSTPGRYTYRPGGAGGKGHQQLPSKERLKQPGPLPAILQLSRAESEHLRLLSSQASWPNSRRVGVSKQAVPSITERSGPIFELVKEHLSGIGIEIDTITRNLYAEGQWIILEEHDDGNNASDFSVTIAFGEFGGFEWQNALDQSTPELFVYYAFDGSVPHWSTELSGGKATWCIQCAPDLAEYFDEQ